MVPMDVKSLYPNCKLSKDSQHIKDTMRLGLTHYKNEDYRRLSKMLALTLGSTGTALDQYIKKPKGTTILHSFAKKDAPGQFLEPEKDTSMMTDPERRAMVGWAICQGLKVTYSNHYYTAGGQIQKQKDGGPKELIQQWRPVRSICFLLIENAWLICKD